MKKRRKEKFSSLTSSLNHFAVKGRIAIRRAVQDVMAGLMD
jgi:hypothetical protein